MSKFFIYPPSSLLIYLNYSPSPSGGGPGWGTARRENPGSAGVGSKKSPTQVRARGFFFVVTMGEASKGKKTRN